MQVLGLQTDPFLIIYLAVYTFSVACIYHCTTALVPVVDRGSKSELHQPWGGVGRNSQRHRALAEASPNLLTTTITTLTISLMNIDHLPGDLLLEIAGHLRLPAEILHLSLTASRPAAEAPNS